MCKKFKKGDMNHSQNFVKYDLKQSQDLFL